MKGILSHKAEELTSSNRLTGFTIIEVSLVIAITGLLFVGLVVSVQDTLRRQRYNDSVASVQEIFANEYDLVANVQNPRNPEERITCNSDEGNSMVTPTTTIGTGGALPGMSNCLVYGRVVEIIGSGTQQLPQTVRTSNVIGRDLTAPNLNYSFRGRNEPTIFRDAFVSRDPNSVTIVSPTWRSTLWNPTTDSDVTVGSANQRATGGFLILRSPATGTIWTYIFGQDADNITSLTSLVDPNGPRARALCVRSDDAQPTQRRAIIVGSAGPISSASNASAVQTAPQDLRIETSWGFIDPVNCGDPAQ